MFLVYVYICNISFKNKIFELFGYVRGRGRGRRFYLKRIVVFRGFGILCVFSFKRFIVGVILVVFYIVSK